MTEQPDIDPATDTTADDTLPPSEATDSDELRNDGDATVTPPESWQPVDEALNASLDDKLAAEQPDVAVDQGLHESVGGGRHRAQVSGTPEDGDSFYDVEE